MFQIFEKAFDSADCTSNIYEWSKISGKEAEISLSSSSSPLPPPPSKYCSIRLAVKVAIHSFETPRACGCVYFSEDRVEHAPTRVHILGLTTHARYVDGIAGILLLDGRRSLLHPTTEWMENTLRILGRCAFVLLRTKLFCFSRRRRS